MKLSRYIKYVELPDRPDSLLLFSTKTTAKAVLPKAFLAAVERGEVTPDEEESLRGMGFLADRDEREEMTACLRALNARRTAFHAVVMLNLDCNLDCPYCFEKDVRGNSYMTGEMAEMVTNFIATNHVRPGHTITVDFYGGEALLSIPTVKSIATQLRYFAEKAGATLTFNLVSNGTLLRRPVVEELVALGLRKVRVTLDGPPETHDRSRPFAGGAGSFDTIVDNLLATWDLVAIQIGGNFTRRNWREFPRLLDVLAERGLTPEKIAGVQFAPVIAQEAGGCRDGSEGCAASSEEWVAEAALALRQEIMRRGYKTPKIAPTVCFAEYDGDVVISYDGTLYKCPGLVSRPEFAVGKLPNAPAGIEKYRPDIWQNDTCLDCRYLPLCFGGCRYLRVQQTGAIDGVDCRKDFYDRTLDELIRQELHHSGQPS